jgi:ABC-type antimicrobial peptide transport system permease subunit
MQKFIVVKSFVFGFLSGILLFLGLNYYTHMQAYEDGLCFHCLREFGFPFYFYKSGTSLHYEIILWSGLIADVVIALVFSILIGLLFGYVWSKFTFRPFKNAAL